MTLLDRCAGGSILEKPKPIERVADPALLMHYGTGSWPIACPLSVSFWRTRASDSSAISEALVRGKSFALAAKLIFLGLRNPGGTLMACEPTFPMIRTVLVPAIDMALDQWDIEYSFRASPQPEYTISLPTGPVTIYCQSAENYQRIRGQNICAAVWDECDTSPVDTAQKAGEMLLARMRTGELNQLAVASTPEGFRWAYRTFVENDGPDKRLIRVRTQDNPHLPADFIPSLERNYPSQLIQAYLEGHFVNLASCSLYPEFDRSLNYCDTQPDERDTIYVGIDLNVGNCVTQHLVRRGDEFHFFAEAVYRDTQQIAQGLKEKYPHHFRTGQLVLIPDAASKQRATAAAQESDIGILKKGWSSGKGPAVQPDYSGQD